MGVELIDYQPIYTDKQTVKFSGLLAGSDAECKVWADILDPKGADVLATYTTGAAAGKAAITSHTFGKGKAIYVGAHLEPTDLARVMLELIATNGVQISIKAPRGVEVTTRKSDRGTLTYVLNHTPSPQTVEVSGSMKDIITGSSHSGSVALDPYGVRVLQSA